MKERATSAKRLGYVIVFAAGVAAGHVATHYYDVSHTGARPTPQPAATTSNAIETPVRARVTVASDKEPLWAYGFTDPPRPGDTAQPQAPPTHEPRKNEDLNDQLRRRSVEGSTASYNLVEIRDLHNVIDWFPQDHPKMTSIIEHGPAAMGGIARGCGSCHLPNGRGRPENAPPGGLPVSYFMRQISDFRYGLRYSADPRKPNTNTMIALATSMSDAEAREAAEYFASIRPIPHWIRVIEASAAPSVRYVDNLAVPERDRGMTPIAGHIIEMPEDEEHADRLRNPRSGFVAYVPPGSIRRGEDLVMTGGMRVVGGKIIQGKTTPCRTCHGMDLTGVVGTDVPPIAGRSPSYVVRQLWDIQQGIRNGAEAQLMKLVVANLTQDDLVSIAAFLASLPQNGPQTAASGQQGASPEGKVAK